MSTFKKNRNNQLINNIYHQLILCLCFLLISQQIWAIDSQDEIANTFSSGSFNVAKVKEQRNKIITVEITKRP